MAQLVMGSCRAYLFARFAICGELAYNGGANETPYAYNYVVNELSKMKSEGLIRLYKYPDGRSFYRLCEPAGTEKLKELSTDLLMHLDLMVGPEGKRYKGSKDYRVKQRKLYEVCALLESTGVTIDGLKAIKTNKRGKCGFVCETSDEQSDLSDTVFFKNGELKSVQQIFEQVNPEEYNFISTKAMRNVSDDAIQLHPRTHMHRSIGILLHGANMYSVYCLQGSREQWLRSVESQAVYQMQRLASMHLPAFEGKKTIGSKKAIFYVPNSNVLTDLVTCRTKTVKIKADTVYNFPYFVPLSENAGDVTRMLLVDDWKKKLNAILSSETSSPDDAEDGWLENGDGMYNFLCCNAALMKERASRINSRRSVSTIVIHDWQKEAAEILFGKNVKAVVINDEQFRILLTAVESLS